MNGIMIEFILWTENPTVSANELSKAIGINPVDVEFLGDTKHYGKFKQLQRSIKETSLLYSTGYVDTVDVGEAIKRMTDILNPKYSTIVDLVDRYKLHAKFCIVINTLDKPIIALEKDFIQMASKLNAEIEFDSYISMKSRFFRWRK